MRGSGGPGRNALGARRFPRRRGIPCEKNSPDCLARTRFCLPLHRLREVSCAETRVICSLQSSGWRHPHGFADEKVIQGFPLRGKPVYLHVRRRRWHDKATGETFSYTYDDLTAEGTKLAFELVAFLKRKIETTAARISSIADAYGVNGKHGTRVLSAHTDSGTSWIMPQDMSCSSRTWISAFVLTRLL